ncbi:restriction endonuclease subunit S [Maritalea mobilis]|uniref:restriction endonuclease subunit S n=1 Tax=Maritalea mobilis TaxID=483324 RepID=UPI001C94CCC3|nr:restriction endonuclease subunit S [Maritalea mobilis]MBY6201044.1 restriction endonuclease subunit S [Maritalea mobilis]
MTTHRLRDVAMVLTSNVDKVVDPDEHPVRLCNYVDVYKNNFIHNDMPFKLGSATAAEIKKFRVKVDDVIITKDSETADDIGVPALVKSTADDLVCGYHLSILRADRRRMIGPFLYWHLLSKKSQEDFGNAANGVTRYGLTLGGIKSIPINVPDLATQRQIADFLDRETARIDLLIEQKQRLVALLGEKLEDDILRAVTLGIDPDAELVPEDELEWTSHRPRHWNVYRLKHFFRENTQYSSDGQETLFSLRMKEGLLPHNDVSDKEIPPSDLINYKKVFPGQIVMNRMRAAIGLFGLANSAGIVSPDYSIFDVDSNAHAAYFLRLFKTEPMMAAFRLLSKGLGTGHSGFMRLNADNFGRIRVAVPEYEEQRLISEYVEERIGQITHLQTKNEQSIDRLKEYRSALIAAAVTGQIDVATYAKSGTPDRRLDAIQEEMGA